MKKNKPYNNEMTKPSRRYYSVKTSTLLYIALRNFLDKKLRSSLTVLAVVIGVCAIFFLISFGLGVQTLVTEQVIGEKSLKAIDVISSNSRILQLNKETVNTISKYPHVENIGVQYSYPGIMSLGGGEVDVVAYGINQEYQSLSALTVLKGRLLTNDDSKAVVLNLSALQAIGIDNSEDAINQKITITIPLAQVYAKESQIYGVFDIVGVIDSGSGGELFIPNSNFDDAGVPDYSTIKVVADELSNVEIIRTQIESTGFETTSLTDTMDEINNIFKLFNTILIGFGSIGMVVAILGMFNTLTVSLLERTKEIGLMMALGARRKDMRKLFIFEAVLISFIGAVIGITLAIILGKIINIYLNIGAASRGISESFNLFVTPLWSIISVILGTVVLGMLVVYFPARRAERINPIDALRRE